MNTRIAVVLAASLTVLLASTSNGQVGILPIQPNQQSYNVRLVNEMGYPIRIKMVRFGSGRYLEEDLPRNGQVTRLLYAGERVLCVWNHNQTLTLAAQVNVEIAGTLRIRPVALPAAAPLGAPRNAAPRKAMEPLPRLKLEP